MERGPNHQSGSRSVPESRAERQGGRAGDQACASKSSAGLETDGPQQEVRFLHSLKL